MLLGKIRSPTSYEPLYYGNHSVTVMAISSIVPSINVTIIHQGKTIK